MWLALLALPLLLVASLMLMGSFLIARLAVMLFPAFATFGVFPAGRGVVVGIGRTVGAALVNSVIYGLGAAVMIRVLGLILDPASRLRSDSPFQSIELEVAGISPGHDGPSGSPSASTRSAPF